MVNAFEDDPPFNSISNIYLYPFYFSKGVNNVNLSSFSRITSIPTWTTHLEFWGNLADTISKCVKLGSFLRMKYMTTLWFRYSNRLGCCSTTDSNLRYPPILKV